MNIETLALALALTTVLIVITYSSYELMKES